MTARTKVTLRHVAEAAGVSKSTVANVFNRPEVVREEVRAQVREAAARLGYAGPDPVARVLSAGRVNALGVATSEPLGYFFDDPWARAMLSRLADELGRRGAGLALVSTEDRGRAAWNVRSAVVDGFVLLCVEGSGELLVRLTAERGLPFVALALDADDPGVPVISVDNREGGRLAAAHLLGLGHRRLGILGIELDPGGAGPATPEDVRRAPYASTRHRIEGVWDAAGMAGLAPEDVPAWQTRNDRATVEAALAGLFAAPAPPTALVALSDKAAVLAVDWLRAQGLRVPGDVSVTGFDGVPEAEAAGLTTVAQPLDEIARRAVAALLDGAVPARPLILAPLLVARATTAPPAALAAAAAPP